MVSCLCTLFYWPKLQNQLGLPSLIPRISFLCGNEVGASIGSDLRLRWGRAVDERTCRHPRHPATRGILQGSNSAEPCQVRQNDSRVWNDLLGLGLNNLGLVIMTWGKVNPSASVSHLDTGRVILSLVTVSHSGKLPRWLVSYSKITCKRVKERAYVSMAHKHVRVHTRLFLHLTHDMRTGKTEIWNCLRCGEQRYLTSLEVIEEITKIKGNWWEHEYIPPEDAFHNSDGLFATSLGGTQCPGREHLL
jgi:hypothetical protein